MQMKFPYASKIMLQYTKLEHIQQVKEIIGNLHKYITVLKLIHYEWANLNSLRSEY